MYKYKYKIDDSYITITEEDNYITNITTNDLVGNYLLKETKLIKDTFKQINSFLNGELKEFNIRHKFNVTPFREKIYKEVMNIKYGDVKTYKEIALLIGNKNASRAVGNALGNNPLLFLMPCHRVIKSDNTLGGFSSTLSKEKLLEMESS